MFPKQVRTLFDWVIHVDWGFRDYVKGFHFCDTVTITLKAMLYCIIMEEVTKERIRKKLMLVSKKVRTFAN